MASSFQSVSPSSIMAKVPRILTCKYRNRVVTLNFFKKRISHLNNGAAVVQDGLFVGTARGLCFGSGLVTSFVASRQRWSLLFLPDGDDGDPIELSGRVERADGNTAWLRWEGPKRNELLRLPPGFLFTGSNGRFCPAGLWIGRATPDQFDRNLLEVRVPSESGPRAVEVLVSQEGR